jgi:hypothetical protein
MVKQVEQSPKLHQTLKGFCSLLILLLL